MTEALVDAFLNRRIAAADFRHADHIQVAHGLLGRGSFLEAAAGLSAGLKAITVRAGQPGAYHETITLAFLALIAERRAAGEDHDFAHFAAANPNLFDRGVLGRWYAPHRLSSDLARRTFLLPDPAR